MRLNLATHNTWPDLHTFMVSSYSAEPIPIGAEWPFLGFFLWGNVCLARAQRATFVRIDYPDISTATITLQTCAAHLEFHRSALHMPPMELMGMEFVKCVKKNGKWGQCLKGFNLSARRISCTIWLRYSQTQAMLWCQATSEHPLVPDMKAPVSAGGYPQPERGRSISPTRTGPVHIPT